MYSNFYFYYYFELEVPSAVKREFKFGLDFFFICSTRVKKVRETMDVFQIQPKRRKLVLSTRRKMNVLKVLDLDSRKCLSDSNNKDSESPNQSIFDTGEVISFLQSEQFHIECLKHLKMCLIHPVLKGSIESSDDIIELVDEMVSAHSSLCSNLMSDKSDMSNVLKILLTSMNAYVSYSVLISLELRNFQRLSDIYTDVYIDFDLLQEPITHVSRYKTLFQNLHNAAPDEAYCSILKAVEMASQNIENALLLKKNAFRTLQIQKLLLKREPKILSPGRIVLKEGILYKVNSKGSGLKERVFFLFNDILLCCKALSKSSNWQEKNSLMFQALFPLNMCLISLVMGSSKQGALFKVTCGTISCLLTSKIPGEAQSWFHELEAAIRTCQKSPVKLKPKLKRQTNISLRHMQRIYPFFKKLDSQKESNDEATNLSHISSKKSSHESIFRLLACTTT